ncbi:MAG: aminotransferase class I/II-fold pyridoxal phosphate-dependent enzyme [Actinomycetota bacterium]
MAERVPLHQSDAWLGRRMETVTDLARLKDSRRMLDAVVDERYGRRIRTGDRWLFDFASSNYLGFDQDREIIDAVPAYLDRWGTQPSWPRLGGGPALYEEIEEKVTELVGGEDTLLFPTVTHIHTSVIPLLAGTGAVFLDARAHRAIHDGAMVARGQGATVHHFRHDDPAHLEELLRSSAITPRVIALDGVCSMLGSAPDLGVFARLARENDALLYVDDTHGFGVVGERTSNELCPLGTRGNGVIRHQGETYENVILVACFSKAYSSLLAFLTLPTRLKDVLKVAAHPYRHSDPSPIASLATTIAGLDVNERRGDLSRLDLYRMTERVLDRLHELDIYTPNRSGYPSIQVRVADREDNDAVGRYLFDSGIYVAMDADPLVPMDELGFRIQITAANDDEQIEQLCQVLGEINERFELRQAQPVRTAVPVT